jgi:hypothetical protein
MNSLRFNPPLKIDYYFEQHTEALINLAILQMVHVGKFIPKDKSFISDMAPVKLC